MSDPSQPAPSPVGPPPVAEHRPWMTNLVLLVICSLLGVWLLLGEPATQTTHQVGSRKAFVFPFFKSEEIIGIEIIRGPERVRLKRPTSGFDTNNSTLPTAGWTLEQPLEDRADDVEVNKLLGGIQHLRVEGKITAEEQASYQFGEPIGKLTFFRDGKAAFALTVGAPRPGAVVPVRDERDKVIYHVKEELREHVERPLWMLRNKQLMAIDRDKIMSVVLETRGAAGPGDPIQRQALVMEQGRWRVGGKAGEHASRTLVDEVLAGVGYYKAGGIAKDGPTPEDLRAFGLDPPRLRITVATAGGEEKATLDIGDEVQGDAQRRYLRIPKRPLTVYTGDTSKLFATLQRSPDDYLDPTLVPLEGGESGISTLRASFADGEELHLARVDKDWTFSAAGPVQLAKNKEVDELVKAILSLTIRERFGAEATPAMGLEQPELHLKIGQGDTSVDLAVGAPKEGQPGVHYVRLHDGDARFVYLVDLGEVPMRLRDGPLELRHPRIFKTSHHDVFGLRLFDETGKVTFKAEKKDPSGGQDTNPIPKWFVEGEELGTDHQRMVAYMKRFEDLRVERWVALDSPEAGVEYGLSPHPRRLVFEARTLDSGGDVSSEERVILLGERIGERIYALVEGGVPAIGLLDASFLDRLTKGFSSESKLFGFAWYDVQGLKVFEGERQVASFARTDKNWMRDGKRVVDDPTALEDECFKPFDQSVGMSRSETASAQRMQERGLDPPAWRLEFSVRTVSGTGPSATHVLLIGNGEGLGDPARWITTPGSDSLGAWYDGPLRKVQSYLRAHPGPK